jgi:hypothetical protein
MTHRLEVRAAMVMAAMVVAITIQMKEIKL